MASASVIPVTVTLENFVRAQTDKLFSAYHPRAFGKLLHFRQLAPLNDHNVRRANRDTLCSVAVFDLDAGPVTFTLPDPGRGFMSLTPFSEDHHTTGSVYGPGEHVFTRENVGTRYAMFSLRTFVDPNDPTEVWRAHALQDAVTVRQAGIGRFEMPDWDNASREKVADTLAALGSTLRDLHGCAGARGEVDPLRHMIATATGWGGNLARNTLSLNVVPAHNDGRTVYRLRARDVPVDGFWSISVYNAQGYFEPNSRNAYSINSITAKPEPDGSILVQFGGREDSVPNWLPIVPGWTYMVRLYRPRPELLDGRWTFPKAEPAGC